MKYFETNLAQIFYTAVDKLIRFEGREVKVKVVTRSGVKKIRDSISLERLDGF